MSKAEHIAFSERKQRESVRLQFENGLAGVSEAASAVEGFLARTKVSAKDAMSIRLAFVEAANNAVQYAKPGSPNANATVEVEADHVRIVVTDHTAGFTFPEKATLPPPDAERGRGLYLIQATMDTVEYRPSPSGNELVLTKKLGAGMKADEHG